ncbi:MFS transporter [Glycomyces sp. NPDC047010]|uniref:MFS transporter n=1 Tax=Glycomyces sp. NPDC047010 TaxID=3155023 RepID=UPI0033EDA7D9
MWILAGLTTLTAILLRRNGNRAAATGPVLLLAVLGVALAQTVVLAVLPAFGAGLGVPAADATWLLTAFMLASAVAVPIAGRLGDLRGHRRVLTAALAALAVGSAAAAAADLAGSFPGLLAGRVLQGLSGAAFPAAFGLARTAVPADRLPRLVAGISAMFGVGGALGMVAAGPLAGTFGTPALFWTTLALAVVALAGTRLLPAEPGTATGRGLDLPGAAALSATLVALLLAVSRGGTWGWTSPATLGLAAAAVLGGAAFWRIEARTAAPLVDLGLLRDPAMRAANLATLSVGVGMFAAVTLIPRLVQDPAFGFAYTPERTGLLMAPMAVTMVVGAPAAARLAARIGDTAVFRLGAALAVLALAGLAFGHAHAWQLYAAGSVMGLAYGLAFASLGAIVVGASGRESTGAATGLNTILRTVGGAASAQVAAVVITAVPGSTGYTAAFLAAACAAAASIGLASPRRVRGVAAGPGRRFGVSGG